MTEWLPKWERNGWKTSNNTDVSNKDQMIQLNDACKTVNVKWVNCIPIFSTPYYSHHGYLNRNLNISVEGAFWPLRRKISNISIWSRKIGYASLLKLTKISIYDDLRSQGTKLKAVRYIFSSSTLLISCNINIHLTLPNPFPKSRFFTYVNSNFPTLSLAIGFCTIL